MEEVVWAGGGIWLSRSRFNGFPGGTSDQGWWGEILMTRMAMKTDDYRHQVHNRGQP